MLGRVERRPTAINYTEVATPLSFDSIRADISRVEYKDLQVGALVMYQHQLDWLRKEAKITPQPGRVAEHFEIRRQGSWSRVEGNTPDTIFGIEVEIANA